MSRSEIPASAAADNPASRKQEAYRLAEVAFAVTPVIDALATAVRDVGGTMCVAVEVDGHLFKRRSLRSRFDVRLREPEDDTATSTQQLAWPRTPDSLPGDPASRRLSKPIEAALDELIDCALEDGRDPEQACGETSAALNVVRDVVLAEWPTWPHGQPMSTAPRDGFAFLATGTHTHSPPDAQRGVKAGDRWWGILLFDIWREPHRFLFAKDGAELWSEPELWCPVPDLLSGDPAPHVLPAVMTPEIGEVLGLMNFATGPLADLFRAAGAEIPRKIEAEQAFVLFRFLHLALKHGAEWRVASNVDVQEALAAAEARMPAEARS